MNLYAKLIFIVGWMCILAGFILGFSFWEVPVLVDSEVIKEKSFAILFRNIVVGTIIGILMFGFSEIIDLLDKQNKTQEKTLKKLNEVNQEFGSILESINRKQGN